MSYFYQPTVISFEAYQEIDRDNRLTMVLSVLSDAAAPLLRKLHEERRGRRDHYPVMVMWQTLIAGIVYKKATITALIEELHINPGLRLLCGIRSIKGIPSASAYSRFLKKLVRHEDELDATFHRLVEELKALLPDLGKTLVIDSTDIHAWANGRRKQPADGDARWGMKKKPCGEGKGEDRYAWFGYKLHLLVCGETELPVGFTVTPANVHDSREVAPLLFQTKERHPELLAGTEYLVGDKAYDAKEIYRRAMEEYRITPIIPLNLRGEKEPPGICNHQGTPICPGKLAMVYAGNDNGYLKYRCPAKCRKGVACPLRVPCRPLKGYGLVVKLNTRDDCRRYTAVPRETKKWERLYAKRTAVERVNGRLKEHLLVDDLRVRGIKKARVRLGLSLMVLLAGALAMAKRERWSDIRKVVYLRAA